MSIRVITNGAINFLVKRYMGPFWIRRRWLEKTQWLSKQELRKVQLELLKKLVHHCYRTVPYYRNLMDELGIQVRDIKTIEDIRLFPTLSKKTVLECDDSIISKKYTKWALRRARTGGSTGTPMTIYRNAFSIGNEHAFVRRQWDWAGVEFSDRCAYLMSRVVAKPDQKGSKLYVYDPAMRELILSTHHLSPETANDYVQAMKSYNIRAIVGYPSAICFLAQTCLNSAINIKLKAALTTSELLTLSVRDIVSKAFHCKVFDFYGSAERVCYIFTCEKGSYHLIPEYGLTELIPVDTSDNGCCRVVSTGFWNLAMPLIRYETGDIVVKSDSICSCGRQFQVVKSIDGREGDVIRTSSGRQFGVTLIIHFLYIGCMGNHILEAQVIQDALDHVTIEYVPSGKFSRENLEAFRKTVSEYLPGELRFDLKQVKAVKRTSSGKIMPVVSHITSSGLSND